ncbi:MAG TPA: LanC-like protein [Hyphomicrobiaceae bacterium]|nr:LanC-like protein [Hyphomicrobiaceae bacterium]
MIDPARRRPLDQAPWTVAEAEVEIRAIIADAAANFTPDRLWPAHPSDDGVSDGTAILYFGAAGVVWALDHLCERGYGSSGIDLAGLLPRLLERSDADYIEFAAPFPGYERHGSLLLGALGTALVAMRIVPDPGTADRIFELCRANSALPVRELMWGLPGSMLAAVVMGATTGEPRWRALFEEQAALVLADLRDSALGPMWSQDLYGSVKPWLGAVHGFAGNAVPLLRGWHWLTRAQQARVEAAVTIVLQRTAVASDDGANWPGVIGEPGDLCQHCHGAPGMVTTFADVPFSSPELEALMVAGGHFIWSVGPLAKGSNLCHGTVGNGYALLKLHRRTGDAVWLDRARAFAMTAIAQCREARRALGRGRYSLWTGDLGLACYLADCITADPRFPTIDEW